ncbi:hypothetical protein [Acinetobacter baumannii]|nr:hypothetical protein [Acinetobacter baumannii]MCV9925938.1 hypothetical protein [Acinetobacter baumannii]MCW1761975.1 hypothetical protein [Acinetobacter baumannii]
MTYLTMQPSFLVSIAVCPRVHPARSTSPLKKQQLGFNSMRPLIFPA